MQIIITLLLLYFYIIAPSYAQTVGIQTLGISNYTNEDLDILSSELSKSKRDVEIAALPFTFNPDDPFSKIDYFLDKISKELNGGTSLSLTVHLWFENVDGRFNFSNPKSEKLFFERFNKFNKWIVVKKNFSKVNLVLSPLLEDHAKNPAEYKKLLDQIMEEQKNLNLDIAIRRSPTPANSYSRLENIPYEFHGRYSDLRNELLPGDLYSNDGCFVFLKNESERSFMSYCSPPVPFEEFLLNQKEALKNKVSFMLWRPEYNGLYQYQKKIKPKNRLNLTPFTGKNGEKELEAIRKVLSTY